MAKKEENCPKCSALYEWDLGLPHNEDRCLGRQLISARREIKQLKASVEGWKDAWFHLRDIIGWLWWHHPAIDNDDQRAYYQTVLRSFRGQPEVVAQNPEEDCFLCQGLCKRDHD